MNAAVETVPKQWDGLTSGFSISIGSWEVIIGPLVFEWIVDQSKSYMNAWLFLAFTMIAVVGILFWGGFSPKYSSNRRNTPVSNRRV